MIRRITGNTAVRFGTCFRTNSVLCDACLALCDACLLLDDRVGAGAAELAASPRFRAADAAGRGRRSRSRWPTRPPRSSTGACAHPSMFSSCSSTCVCPSVVPNGCLDLLQNLVWTWGHEDPLGSSPDLQASQFYKPSKSRSTCQIIRWTCRESSFRVDRVDGCLPSLLALMFSI